MVTHIQFIRKRVLSHARVMVIGASSDLKVKKISLLLDV